MQNASYDSFADITKRLNEIADQVAGTDLPLEEALSLYEEAVNLGLHATDLLEDDISEEELAEANKENTSEGENASADEKLAEANKSLSAGEAPDTFVNEDASGEALTEANKSDASQETEALSEL